MYIRRLSKSFIAIVLSGLLVSDRYTLNLETESARVWNYNVKF